MYIYPLGWDNEVTARSRSFNYEWFCVALRWILFILTLYNFLLLWNVCFAEFEKYELASLTIKRIIFLADIKLAIWKFRYWRELSHKKKQLLSFQISQIKIVGKIKHHKISIFLINLKVLLSIKRCAIWNFTIHRTRIIRSIDKELQYRI